MTPSRRRLLLFAKRPIEGQVKTRLCPPLSPGQALALYRAFFEDQLRFLASFGSAAEVELWLDGPWDPRSIPREWVDPLVLHEQGAGDLGERLARAFAHGRLGAAAATVVIGVDSPTLPAEHVLRAFERLEREDAQVVLGPAADGGYVLLGLRDPLTALFRGVPWGTDRVAEATRTRAAETGASLAELDPWYDVDDALGLARLRREITAPRVRERAPATARWLDFLDSAIGRVV